MGKKQFSSFDVAAVVRELQSKILGSRIRNIYQLESGDLLFKLRKSDEGVYRLIMDPNRRLHLTSYSREKPQFPPDFCMALRKYLRNCLLTDIQQYRFERVVVFSFETWAGKMEVYLELFGGGNLILVDKEGKIIQALKYKRMRDRDILRDENFRFAPPIGRNPLEISREEFVKEMEEYGEVEVVRAIARFLDIGGFYAEEVLLRANLNKQTSCKDLGKDRIKAVFEKIQNLLSQVSEGELNPCIVLNEEEKYVDVVPFRLQKYNDLEHECFESFNKALDVYYVKTSAIESARSATTSRIERLTKEAERLKRIIKRQKRAITKSKAKAQRNKRVGDTIYTHAGTLKALLRRFLNCKRDDQQWEKVISQVLAEKERGEENSAYFESFDKKTLVLNVNVHDLKFGLSLRRNLFENAAEFYKKYKRAKQKLKGAKSALKESQQKLRKMEEQLENAETAKEIKPVQVLEEVEERKIKKKRWFEKFRWFISSDGFLVVAGKDAVSNEVVVKKYAEENDIVFHADVLGSPFVVVKTEGKEVSEQCLQEAAIFAASFSRGWREGFASIDVYWVKPDQLSKDAPSGEYIPKGGFVVRGRRNWMRGTPLKLSAGIIQKDKEIKFVGGPKTAVESKTKRYVVIMPGNLEGKELFKEVLKALAEKSPKEIREKVVHSSFEEIREYLPYNQGRVI